MERKNYVLGEENAPVVMVSLGANVTKIGQERTVLVV